MKIRTRGNQFVDETGRTLLLRGVNLGGSSKVPFTPDGATHLREHFYDHRNVSFVGRPFPLEEADEHFARLKQWGMRFLRFLVTWEAVEHAGPGEYDRDYLDYLRAVVEKAAEYDFYLFIDPHQDVWSRWTGGDGAPGWIFEKLGMDLTKFHATSTASIHQEHGEPLPRMTWASNYTRYACATMWTLFFAGNDFAPQTLIDGVPVQDYLQGHYINAMREVAKALRGCGNVVGYDTLNEPHNGLIGLNDVRQHNAANILNGPSPTAWEGMLLAAGYPQQVLMRSPIPWKSRTKRVWVNEARQSIWLPGAEPIWKQNGVWDVGEDGQPRLLRPDYFAMVNGEAFNFDERHFRGFIERYIAGISDIDPEAIFFVSPVPEGMRLTPAGNYSPEGNQALAHAPHWYDSVTLITRRHLKRMGVGTKAGRIQFLLGRRNVRAGFETQLAELKRMGSELLGEAPTLIGETGIPFDLNRGKSYVTGDFSAQVAAMDATMQALEANLLSFTLWNYTADNDNEYGDRWNHEDLSIFSRDQMIGNGSPYDGGRALQAVLRPYPFKIPGRLQFMRFDIDTRVFEVAFELDASIEGNLELFIPEFQYPGGCNIEAAHGGYQINLAQQWLRYTPDRRQVAHMIRVEPA